MLITNPSELCSVKLCEELFINNQYNFTLTIILNYKEVAYVKPITNLRKNNYYLVYQYHYFFLFFSSINMLFIYLLKLQIKVR